MSIQDMRTATDKLTQCEARIAYVLGTRYVPMPPVNAAMGFLRRIYAECPALGVARVRPLVRGDARRAVGLSCSWAWGGAEFAVKFRESAGPEWCYRYGANTDEVMRGTGSDGLSRLRDVVARHEAVQCKS